MSSPLPGSSPATAVRRSDDATPVAASVEIDGALAPLRHRVLAHPIYGAIADEAAVIRFMEHHVFAVWDFMSLVKSLARRLSCVDVPWIPTPHAAERRFVNEIVLDEESDLDASGRPTSHFEMYVDAMDDAGASTGPIRRFVDALREGHDVDTAARIADATPAARAFVASTLSLAEGSDAEVAAGFAYGRELVIPPMFRAVVGRLRDRDDARWAPFAFYLERHIETDGETHGPMARAIVDRLVGTSPERKAEALRAAERALEARLALWNAAEAAIRADRAR